jgi:F-type H+-transporting ATPase subunit b
MKTSYRIYGALAAAVGLSLLAPSLVFAAAEEHAPLFGLPLLYHAINFAVLIGVLVFLLRRPVRDYLSNRRDEVRRAIEEAHAVRTKAEAALAEYTQKLAGIDAELAAMRADIASAGARERDLMVGAAEQQAAKLIAEAKLVGEQEIRRARETLRAEMVALATELATKQVQTSLQSGDKDRQLDEFVTNLERLS